MCFCQVLKCIPTSYTAGVRPIKSQIKASQNQVTLEKACLTLVMVAHTNHILPLVRMKGGRASYRPVQANAFRNKSKMYKRKIKFHIRKPAYIQSPVMFHLIGTTATQKPYWNRYVAIFGIRHSSFTTSTENRQHLQLEGLAVTYRFIGSFVTYLLTSSFWGKIKHSSGPVSHLHRTLGSSYFLYTLFMRMWRGKVVISQHYSKTKILDESGAALAWTLEGKPTCHLNP